MDKSYKKLIPTLLCRRRFLPKYIFKIDEKYKNTEPISKII